MTYEEVSIPISPNYFEEMIEKGFFIGVCSEPYEFIWEPDNCVKNQPHSVPLAKISQLSNERPGHRPDCFDVGYVNKILFFDDGNKPMAKKTAEAILERTYHRFTLTGTKVSDGLPVLWGELFIYHPKTARPGKKEANVELYLDSVPKQKYRSDLF